MQLAQVDQLAPPPRRVPLPPENVVSSVRRGLGRVAVDHRNLVVSSLAPAWELLAIHGAEEHGQRLVALRVSVRVHLQFPLVTAHFEYIAELSDFGYVRQRVLVRRGCRQRDSPRELSVHGCVWGGQMSLKRSRVRSCRLAADGVLIIAAVVRPRGGRRCHGVPLQRLRLQASCSSWSTRFALARPPLRSPPPSAASAGEPT
mmetsp:Transcript_66963/g.159769  ORF Transcript_66963/g.159769 Transcript_66963/m.159769 type:complete len:202 (-) Transcript_66963:167-772(-)